jgi:hypothetical protein
MVTAPPLSLGISLATTLVGGAGGVGMAMGVSPAELGTSSAPKTNDPKKKKKGRKNVQSKSLDFDAGCKRSVFFILLPKNKKPSRDGLSMEGLI